MDDIFDLFVVDDEPTPPKPVVQVEVTAPVVEAAPTAMIVEQPKPVVQVEVTPSESANLRMLDCGHTDWFSTTEHDAARAAGSCCEGGRRKMPVSWRDLKGRYIRPIPEHARRTKDRERSPGFPGLCCDHEGYYIGGVTNDCRFGSPDDRRCPVHGGVEPVVEQPEPVEIVEPPEPVAVASKNPPLPPAGASWKQRQLSAKRGK